MKTSDSCGLLEMRYSKDESSVLGPFEWISGDNMSAEKHHPGINFRVWHLARPLYRSLQLSLRPSLLLSLLFPLVCSLLCIPMETNFRHIRHSTAAIFRRWLRSCSRHYCRSYCREALPSTFIDTRARLRPSPDRSLTPQPSTPAKRGSGEQFLGTNTLRLIL